MASLIIQNKPCTGCRLCEQWCTWNHFQAVNPARARLHIVRHHERYANEVIACIQCDDPACVGACPNQALQRDSRTGGLILDADSCLLCGACSAACTTGVLRLDPVSDLPLACDLCGGDPQCVRHCPEGVLAFGDLPEAERVAAVVFSEYVWRSQ